MNESSILKGDQRLKDQYDLVDDIFVSRVGMAEEDHHTRLASELFALMSGLLTRDRRVQTHTGSNVEVLLGKGSKKRCGRTTCGRNKCRHWDVVVLKVRKKWSRCRNVAEEKCGRGERLTVRWRKVLGARKLGAVSRMMPQVLLEELRAHLVVVACVECMVICFAARKKIIAVMEVTSFST